MRLTKIQCFLLEPKILVLSLSYSVYLTQKTQDTFRGFAPPGERRLEYLMEQARLCLFLKPLVQANPAV